MPLDLRLDGDIAGLKGAAEWMSRLARGAGDAGDDVNAARREAERGWTGPSGTGFVGHAGKFRDGADAMRDGGEVVARGLAAHAEDLDQVRILLDRARETAAAGGLSTSDVEIAEPGPAPPQPVPLPPGATADQVQAQDLVVQAASAHQIRAAAYREAQQTIGQARKTQQDSQNVLIELLGGHPVKIGLQLTDVSSGLMGSAVGATARYRKAAEDLAGEAARRANVGLDRSLPPSQRARALLEKNVLAAKSATAEARATSTPFRRGLDQIPERVQKVVIDPKISSLESMPGRVGKIAGPVLSKVPVAGLLLTGAGIGVDIATGKDPTKAIASGAGAFVTGAVVGAAIGGPVGVVVGAAVGMGVGYLIDHWDDDPPPPKVLAPGREDGMSGATAPA